MSIEDMAMSPMAIEALERDVANFLKDISDDDSLERFRVEYKKLHRALRKSHESEKRLIKKCQDLSAEIVSNAQKVQTALKLSQEDQATILSMKKEIEKAWKMVDAAHDKESRAKETIQQLKREIHNLSQLVEQGAGLTLGQENTVNELIRVKNDLTKERETLTSQIARLRTELRAQADQIETLTSDAAAKAEAIAIKEKALTDLTDAMTLEQRKRARAETQANTLNQHLSARQSELREKQGAIVELQGRVGTLGDELRDANHSIAGLQRECEAQHARLKQHSESVTAEVATNTLLLQKVKDMKAELELREIEVAALRAADAKAAKLRDAHLRDIKQLREEKDAALRKAAEVRQVADGLEKQMLVLTTTRDQLMRQVDDVARERDGKAKAVQREEKERHKMDDHIKVEQQRVRTLQAEVEAHRRDAQAQRKAIYRLEREREQYAAAASEVTAKYNHAVEELKMRVIASVDGRKQLTDAEARMRQQQALYEGVRAERNLYSRNLLEATDEIVEMNRKFRILAHQVEQLKEEVVAKDRSLVEEQTLQKKREKEVEQYRAEVAALRQQNEAASAKVAKLDQAMAGMHTLVSDLNEERLRQRAGEKRVVAERNHLATQVKRRNTELALLQANNQVQQSTLVRSEMQYRERLVQVKLLQEKVAQLKSALHIAQDHVSSQDATKRQLHQRDKQLLAEQVKVQRLTSELENPHNLHRWRRLGGGEGKDLDVARKVQALQRRLIAKTEECVEREMTLREKDRLYQQLKEVLARQPGPEVAEQLNVYHDALRKRTAQMKSMASELNLATTHTSELQYEFERRTAEVSEYKRKYLEQRLQNQLLVREKALAEEAATAAKEGRTVGQLTLHKSRGE